MNYYSEISSTRLDTCHPDLKTLFIEALEVMDHSILTGYRDEDIQNKAFDSGNSQKRFPESKHNLSPSLAVDAIPYPVDWDDKERMILFAGILFGIAHKNKIQIRWGGDWDKDFNLKDNSFDDLTHFELIVS